MRPFRFQPRGRVSWSSSRPMMRAMGRRSSSGRSTSYYGSLQSLLPSTFTAAAVFSTTNNKNVSNNFTAKRKDDDGNNNNNNNGNNNSSSKTPSPGAAYPSQRDFMMGHNKGDFVKRIVVKANSSSSSSNNNKALKQEQRVGVFKRRFPMDKQIQDSKGKTIYLPAQSMVHTQYTTELLTLPQLRAAAWLDPGHYCRGGGDSRAGSDASRNLLRGKKDFMTFVRHAVHHGGTTTFCLQHHGIPQEFLQHVIDFGGSVLRQLRASECSFKEHNTLQQQNSQAALTAVKELKTMRVRDLETGENRVESWPADREDWRHDLSLYWTAMNRIATRLGVAVLWKRPRKTNTSTTTTATTDNKDDTSPNSLLSTPPYYWKVDFERGLHYAPEQFLPATTSRSTRTKHDIIHPVMEWTPLADVAAPGHVCIRLQGFSSSSLDNAGAAEQQPPLAVSLCFDACFRNNPRGASTSTKV